LDRQVIKVINVISMIVDCFSVVGCMIGHAGRLSASASCQASHLGESGLGKESKLAGVPYRKAAGMNHA
jgi:hypothetical protein